MTSAQHRGANAADPCNPMGPSVDRAFNTIVLLAGTINLGLALILARGYAAIGMACSVVTAEAFVASNIYLLLRHRKLDPLQYAPGTSGETL